MSFRVLSIDGGGIRGYLSARILANIEKYLDVTIGDAKPLGARFDLIAGTSAGGIVALGLANGLRAADVAGFFEKYSARIFPAHHKKNWVARKFAPAYSTSRLQAALTSIFSATSTLRDLKTDVCITGVALGNAKPKLYKTDYFARNAGRLDESLIDVALATSAAPTYFEAHSSKHSTNVVDGGVCANNPSMVAVVDAMQFERPSRRQAPQPNSLADLALLSIGTGDVCAMTYDHNKLAKGGELAWAKAFYEVATEAQSQLVHFQAKFLIPNYLRVNPQLKFAMALDDHENLEELRNLSDLNAEIEMFVRTHLSS